MTKVVIVRNWQEPDLFRQTPERQGRWDDVDFTHEKEGECDYVVVLNYSPQEITLNIPKENVWCLMQEPPNEYFRYRHKANKVYRRVFTQEPTLTGERYIHTQPALPWHINKSYDFLKRCNPPEKKLKLSAITSNKRYFQGQKERMNFLDNIEDKLPIDIFGWGVNPLIDKWDGLAPYRYSLVIENFSGPNYWSEKLADCFLAWTMPIYFGCTNIYDYFPKKSLISIDIYDSKAVKKISKIITSNLWRKNINAITCARKLILEKYQFFPFVTNKIKEYERNKKNIFQKEKVVIPNEDTFINKSILTLRRIIGRL